MSEAAALVDARRGGDPGIDQPWAVPAVSIWLCPCGCSVELSYDHGRPWGCARPGDDVHHAKHWCYHYDGCSAAHLDNNGPGQLVTRRRVRGGRLGRLVRRCLPRFPRDQRGELVGERRHDSGDRDSTDHRGNEGS